MNNRLKKFLSYYKPYLRLFSAVLTCTLIVSVISLSYPLLTRYITKDVLEGNISHALNQIYIIGALMLLLVLIQNACNFFSDYQGHKLGAMMESDMRSELFDHLQKLSFRFYDKQKTGQLMSRITNDLLLLSELYHHGPEDYLRYLVKFIGAFVILMMINVKLTLAVFMFLPPMAFFALILNKRINLAIKRNKARIADINSQVEDSLSGIRVVKSFANEDIEREKFAYENNRFLESRKSTYRNEAYLYNGMETFIQLITITVIVFGGVNIVNASLDLADLITFLLYIGYLIEPLQKLTHMTMQYQEGITGFERFMEILEIEPDIQDSRDAIDLKDVKGNIEFKNVGFKYLDTHDYVLENISLDVKAGDYIALVGPSGAGKTTLCSLIPRFYDVREGEILLDGINIKNISLDTLRRNIGVVQQDVYLFAGTVLDNIRYGKPNASKEEIIEAAIKANAHNFIMGLPDGYETDIGQRGVTLSGGQKQRLSIARVFLKNPPILIFDEATSALDNESERVVQKALDDLAKNRTTFVIAHRLSTVRNAKRVVVLTDHGIDEEGTHEELLAYEGTYAHLYQMQFKIS
ncbi:thiamine ABC transporter permease [Bacillus sp. SA1-12]|uniref:ABC transporter ATP-binding protein n=1 Tax=Bacillus sp. SA1-12 TaxID=1455638 RepID=UPI0006272553|nr:ABC transporter ATP-binding protein [Bacillus sp. SA1-12]KKI90075.1 thiamine ABC transporter permease [Bacillus sp. SA1-12]